MDEALWDLIEFERAEDDRDHADEDLSPLAITANGDSDGGTIEVYVDGSYVVKMNGNLA